MTIRTRGLAGAAILALAMAAVALPAAAEQAGKGPLKVFILAGQSNMEGQGAIKADPNKNGGKGSLEFLVKDAATAERFKGLMDKDGAWVVRKDVWIWYLGRKGGLTVGYGAKQDRIGPELGFGRVVGDALDNQVLLIKTAWGGKSLAVDFRPPSSGAVPEAFGAKLLEKVKADPEMVGKYYREMLKNVSDVLKNLKTEFPDYDGQGYEIAGFGWHQGWNDRISDQFTQEYEKNLANLIRDVRKDLGAKNLPFVVAATGMGGREEVHPRAVSLVKAQAAVEQYPEFKGNVAFVDARDFWRPKEVSPSGQGYHWNSNAETYFLIGEGMGKAMVEMLKSSAGKAPE